MKSATLDKRLCLFVWLYLCPFLVLCFFSRDSFLVEMVVPFLKSTHLSYLVSLFWQFFFSQDIDDKIQTLAVEHFPARFQLSAISFLHVKANIHSGLMLPPPFHCLVCFVSIGWIICRVPHLDDIHNMLMVDTHQHSCLEQSSQQNVFHRAERWIYEIFQAG